MTRAALAQSTRQAVRDSMSRNVPQRLQNAWQALGEAAQRSRQQLVLKLMTEEEATEFWRGVSEDVAESLAKIAERRTAYVARKLEEVGFDLHANSWEDAIKDVGTIPGEKTFSQQFGIELKDYKAIFERSRKTFAAFEESGAETILEKVGEGGLKNIDTAAFEKAVVAASKDVLESAETDLLTIVGGGRGRYMLAAMEHGVPVWSGVTLSKEVTEATAKQIAEDASRASAIRAAALAETCLSKQMAEKTIAKGGVGMMFKTGGEAIPFIGGIIGFVVGGPVARWVLGSTNESVYQEHVKAVNEKYNDRIKKALGNSSKTG